MKRMAVVLGALAGAWCGSADEALVGLDDLTAQREVAGGTLTWTERAAGVDAATLPADLTNGLAFWVDANANVVTNSAGGVQAWLDVREAPVADEADWTARTEAGDWSYARALLYTATEKYAGVPPTVQADREGFAGLRFVDFGEYGSGRWLMWADAQGNHLRLAVRSYFCVVGFGDSAGFILADVSDPARGGSGYAPYHKGSGGGDGKNDAISARASLNNSRMEYGETRLDGVRVIPYEAKYARRAVQLFGQNGPAVYQPETCPEPWVSTFFNNSNYKKVDGRVDVDRQGGGQLGEILCYDRVLADDERARVEAYLWQKWFGRAAAGRVALAADAALVADMAKPAAVRGVEGTGTLVKRGEGTLAVAEGAGLFAGGLRLEGGAVALAQKRALPALDAFGAATVEVAADGARRVADAADAAGTFAVRGTGASARAPLGAVAEAVTTLDVTDAAVVLRPAADVGSAYRPATAFERIGNLIVNGGFEANNLTGGYDHEAITAEGWEAAATTNGFKSLWGLTKTGTPWLQLADGTPVPVPEGQVAAYLQGRADSSMQGRLRQTVTVPMAGLYRLSFQATLRAQKANCSVGVYLDDRYVFVRRFQDAYRMAANGVSYVKDRAATDFQTMGCDLPLTAGAHTLTFEVTLNDTADRAVLLDDVRLVPLVEGDFAWVPGAGFESVQSQLSALSPVEYGQFGKAPAGTFWTFEEGRLATTNFVNNTDGSVTTNIVVYDGGVGLARTPGTWFRDGRAAEAFEDGQVAFIQRTAALENTVAFPRDGRVCLSVRYANRSGGGRPTGHSCRVTLDGEELASFTPAVSTMTTFRHVFEVTAGTHVVRFQGVVPGVKEDYATILDDVRFQYVDDEPGIVKDPSFAREFSSEGGWTADGSVARLRLADRDVAAASLAGTASLARTFTTPSNGVWALTFDMAGRPVDLASASGVYNSYKYYPHRVGVWVDGAQVTSLVAESPISETFTLRLPWLAAGEHTLAFKGETTAPTEARTLVGGVRIDPLAVQEALPDLAERTLRLSGSAKAVLDFAGALRVGRVQLDGKAVTGVLDATTHPAWFEGSGQIVVKPRGTVLILR